MYKHVKVLKQQNWNVQEAQKWKFNNPILNELFPKNFRIVVQITLLNKLS